MHKGLPVPFFAIYWTETRGQVLQSHMRQRDILTAQRVINGI
jgi:hypothetical protein